MRDRERERREREGVRERERQRETERIINVKNDGNQANFPQLLPRMGRIFCNLIYLSSGPIMMKTIIAMYDQKNVPPTTQPSTIILRKLSSGDGF